MKITMDRKVSYKLLLSLQLLALLAGSYVGWSTILREVQIFCTNEARGLSSLMTFNGTVTTNPLITPCFWGTIAFTVAIIWTIRLFFIKDKQKRAREHKHLLILLIAGTVFAVVNNIPLFYRFYTTPRGTATSCSPGKLMTNPFMTSCFYGFAAFATATFFSAINKPKQTTTKEYEK